MGSMVWGIERRRVVGFLGEVETCRRSRARGIVETCVCDRYGRNSTQHRPKNRDSGRGNLQALRKRIYVHMLYIYIYIIETRLNKVTYLEKQNKTNHGSPLPHSEQVTSTSLDAGTAQ